ncbi:hypothetical protein [Roseivirga sp.]|uniref:hypothetical protein n=1 Tax=Roseivirga sp. TaxID=1964215 RepID=UPI003B5271C8
MRIKSYWLLIFLGITLASFFYYQQNQDHLTYDLAPSFDGNDYRNGYDYFVGYRNDYQVPPPFHQRILVPWLASVVSGEIIQAFHWLNLVFSIAAVIILFLLWRRLGFELKWFWAGFIWLIFHWTGMIRLNAFDPITVDLPTFAFQALFLWLVLERRFIHLLWLAPLATLQKESFMALPIILLVYGAWHNKKTQEGYYKLPLIGLAVLLAIMAQIAASHYFPPAESGKNAIITIAYHAREALTHPFELVRWLAAMSMAFGPALWLAIHHYGKTNRYDNTRNLLVIYTALYLSFGLLAGGDMTRIIFLGFPFVASWIMLELQETGTKRLLLIGLLSLPLTFIWKHIPDPAWQWEVWESWYPEFMGWETVLIVLGFSLFGAFVIKKLY